MRTTPQRPWWHGVVWGAFIWLLVPAALFALGYNVIGPRVGTVPALNSKVDDLAQSMARTAEAGSKGSPIGSASEEPQPGVPKVEVEVTPTKPKEEEERPRTRRRSRPRPEPEKEEPKQLPKEEREEAGGGTESPPPESLAEEQPIESPPPPTTGGDGG